MLLSDSEIFSSATQELEKRPFIFEKLGFLYQGHSIQKDALTGSSLWFSFVHAQNQMKLNIVLSPATPKQDGRVGVYLVTPTNRTLDVEDYLRVHHFPEETILFTYTQQVPSFDTYLNNFLIALERLLATELKPIIEGKQWENIPFEWGDYK